MADTIDRAVGEPLAELKTFRLSAERSRKKASIQARSRFSKEISQIAVKLRAMDIDRIFLDAAVAEIHLEGRGDDPEDLDARWQEWNAHLASDGRLQVAV